MNKKRKLLSLLLVIAMMIGVVSTSMLNAFAEESVDFMNETDNKLSISLTKKDGTPLGGNESASISNGDSLRIKVAFELNNNNLKKDKICVDLNKLNYISQLKGGNIENNGNILGKFEIIDGILNIRYDWDMIEKIYADKNTFNVSLDIDAKADYNNDNLDDEGNIIFKIRDKEYKVPNVFPDSNVNVEKICLGDGTSNDCVKTIGGVTYQKFQIKATSSGGNNKNVILKDTLQSSNLSFAMDIDELKPTMTIDNVSKDCIFNVDNQKATITVGDLDDKQTAIITYWVKISDGAYKEAINESWKLKNKVTSSFIDNNDHQKDDQAGPEANIKITNLTIDKTAKEISQDNTTKKVEWTVTITGGDVNTGYKFSDNEILTGNGSKENGSILIKKGDTKLGTISFDELSKIKISDNDDLSNFKISLKKGEQLTFIYTNTYDIKNVDIKEGLFSKNTFEATKENYPTIKKETDYTVVPKLDVSITKKYQSYDLNSKKLTWKVSVTIPKDFTDLVLSDVVSDGHTLIPDSLKYIDKDNNENPMEFVDSKISLDSLTNYITETDGRHTYNFIYQTKDNDTQLSLENTAKISYKYNDKDYSNSSKAEYNKNPIIEKNGYNDSNKGIQTWSIKFNLEIMDLEKNTMIITDTIPEGLELIKDSFKLENESVSLDIEGSFKADVTDILKDYKKKYPNQKTVQLSYQTRVKDIEEAIQGKKYTNRVIGKYGGNDTGECIKELGVSIDQWGLLNKECSYDAKDPTVLKYVVRINTNGAKLALNDANTLQMYDELGSALKYVKDSVKVYRNVWYEDKNNEITDNVTIKIDNENNTLTIDGIPDETFISVYYSCKINLPSGTKINDQSSQELLNSVTNKVQLRSVRNYNNTSSTTFKGEVQSASGTMHPKNCTLTINKIDQDKLTPLKGAKFKIYMVKIENGKFVEVNPQEVLSYTGAKTLETNDKGQIKFSDMMYDYYYCYEEINAPIGYDGHVKGYILFDGPSPKSNVENELPAGINFQRVYNYIGALDVTAKNEKVKTGKLIINKSITGIDIGDYKDKIKFKVTKESDSTQSMEYTLNDFTYNKQTKKWELELNEEIGNYIVEEIENTIDGYTVKTMYQTGDSSNTEGNTTNILVEEDKDTTVSFKNDYELKKHDVIIKKVDAAHIENQIAGAKLKVVKKGTTDGIISWTSEEGKSKTLKLEAGDYTLIEEKAPYGYKVADPINFTVTKDGGVKIDDNIVDQVIMKDSHSNGQLVITKTISGIIKDDIKNKIKFIVKDNTTNVSKEYKLDDFNYDEENKIWKKTLDVVEGSYTVEEIVEDSKGYKLVSTTYQVTQNGVKEAEVLENLNDHVTVEDEKAVTVSFKNSYTPKEYEISISKQDLITSKDISGADLEIKNIKTGEVIQITSSELGQKLNLIPGTYTLSEEKAPEGYKKAKSIEFIVTKEGKIIVDGKEVEKVVMKDQPIGQLVLTKSIVGDVSREQVEKSVSFEITNNDTKEIKTYSLKDFSYVDSKWALTLTENTGGYTVKEITKDIQGYVLVNTVYTIEGQSKEGRTIQTNITKGNTTNIDFVNKYEKNKYSVKINKVNSKNQKIAGAKLEIIDLQGNVLDTWTSAKDQSHELSLESGTYILSEIDAPQGYRKANDIEFTVDEDGKVEGLEDNTVVMKDELTEGKLILTKTIEGDITKEQAKNITFVVTDQEGKKQEYTLDTFDYDETTHLYTKEIKVREGKYTVEEINQSIKDHEVKTTYTINNQENEGTKVDNITIEDKQEVIVNYKNTYLKNDEVINQPSDSNDQTPKDKTETLSKQEVKQTKTGDESALLENMVMAMVSLIGILKGIKVYHRRKEI